VFGVVDGGVPDSASSMEQLGSRIVALSGRLASATCRWLLLVGEFDARDGGEWKLGMASTAQWLQYACGVARRTAIEHVRIARSLRAWPQLAAEMSAGRLSYSQVRAISRVATGPVEQSLATGKLVDGLIESARYGSAAQLEAIVRGLRTVHHNETEPGPRAERERVSQSWTDGSQWALSARLDPERGAQVEAALAALAKAEELGAADALVRLAEIGLAALADGGQPRGLRGEEQAAIVVHVDASRVPAEPDTPDPERSAERARAVAPFGRVADGPGLPASVVERLACIGRVRLTVRDGDGPHSDVLDLGRARRLVTPRQRQALRLRDGDECAYPGCHRRDGLEAHHVRHWLYGGRTDLDNLLRLCKAHHLAHHDGEFTVTALGRGRFRFYRNHRELPRWADPSTLITTPVPIEDEHPDVAADAATPKWDGSRMDHEWAITAHAQHLNLPARA
jgi:hypothetical protein